MRRWRLRPTASTLKLIAARRLLELDRFDEAMAAFDKALGDDPGNVVALMNRGNACIKDKRFARGACKAMTARSR